MEYAEAFLKDQISAPLRSLIPATLKTAYEAASLLIEQEPILSVKSAQGQSRSHYPMGRRSRFSASRPERQWPFDFRWTYFERPTGRYLEILPSHCVVTISQVDNPSKQPRDVRFRANKRLNSQGWLAGMSPDDQPSAGIPHVLLIHGHQTLNFAHLAIPKEEQQSGYHFRSANLMLMPHSVVSSEPPPEDTDIEAVVTLKEEIDKWRKDNE